VARTAVSEEELQLRKRARRRLVGAIALVLLVVVLVPMFLEHEPRSQKQDMDIRIPPIPGPTQERGASTTPPSSPPAAVSPQTTNMPAERGVETAPDTSTPAPLPAEPGTAKPPLVENKTAATTAPPATQSSGGEGYVIQLGAYSNAANAKQLLRQLKAHKFPAYTETVKAQRGGKLRVRVGPYPSAEVAEKARERLKTLKLMPVSDAKVVRMGE